MFLLQLHPETFGVILLWFLYQSFHGLKDKEDATQGANAAPITFNFLKPGATSIDSSYTIVPPTSIQRPDIHVEPSMA